MHQKAQAQNSHVYRSDGNLWKSGIDQSQACKYNTLGCRPGTANGYPTMVIAITHSSLELHPYDFVVCWAAKPQVYLFTAPEPVVGFLPPSIRWRYISHSPAFQASTCGSGTCSSHMHSCFGLSTNLSYNFTEELRTGKGQTIVCRHLEYGPGQLGQKSPMNNLSSEACRPESVPEKKASHSVQRSPL